MGDKEATERGIEGTADVTKSREVEESKSIPSLSLWEKIDDLIRTDQRVGYVKDKPKLDIHNFGWFFSSHIEMIDLFVSGLPNVNVILELGSYMGRSTMHFASKFPNAVVFAVDLWDNSYLLKDTHYQSAENVIILQSAPLYEQFLVNSWALGYHAQLNAEHKGIVPMRMDTCAAMEILHSLGIQPDLLYVDANHHFEGAKRDIEEAVTLFPDAHIMGDDWDYSDVRRAAQHVAKEKGLQLHVVGGKVWSYSNELLTKQQELKRQQEKEDEEKEKHAAKRQKVETKGLSFQKMLSLYKNKV